MENEKFGCGRKNFQKFSNISNVNLSLVIKGPMEIISELNKIQKKFVWNGNNPKN